MKELIALSEVCYNKALQQRIESQLQKRAQNSEKSISNAPKLWSV